MKEFRKLYRKFAGKKLLYQWFKAGVLLFASCELLLLGFSKKGLEILRLGVQFKTISKLKKKYKYVLEKSEKIDFNSLSKQQSNYVWVCWLQGIENAPFLVQQCFDSLRKNLKDKEIVVLTSENIDSYVQFPDFIIEKWNKGIITNTHFSDLLRVEVLIKHGGTWIDSTVLCTSSDIPGYIFNSDFFCYQILKPGKDGHVINISSWLLSSTSNNKILLITRNLLYEYWTRNNYLLDYFLFHMFLEIVLEKYPDDRNKIVKFCNSTPHILLLDLFEPYNEENYNIIRQMTCFHKLNYKRKKEDFEKTGTYYDEIINKGNY